MRIPALKETLYEAVHFLNIERLFRKQHHERTESQPEIQRDPAGMPTHHLHKHHALMGIDVTMQPVDDVDSHYQRAFATDQDRHIDAIVDEGLLDLIQPGP